LRFLVSLALLLTAGSLPAQQPAQNPQTDTQKPSAGSSSQPSTPQQVPNAPEPHVKPAPPTLKPQPKRILGIMPNYRAVSAGSIPPPPTPRQAFKIATLNSFDRSSYIFVGITSLLAEGTNAHPQLGKGPGGFWGYYWRGFLDKTDGNYLVIYALPTVLHEDERYFAMGQGGIVKRGVYAASRVIITPNYQGHNTFNASEIFGRGISQAISISYYPSADRTFEDIAEKYGYAIGRDALTNTFREFWPDIAAHLHHHHPQP
jgi:hypothetical protein